MYIDPMDPFSPPQEAPSLPTSLRIISLNCWGLKYLAKHRHERLSEIGNELANASPTPEIVALQECWTQQDYLDIRNKTEHILPYAKFYYSGIFGGGLAILSKWPIEESSMFRYPLNGRPTAFFRGDWFVGKGVAHARIRIGPAKKDVVEVFCTHLHAPYEREPNDSYICHRTAQAWEIAKLMRAAAERGHLVLGLGDFNMIPLSLAHRLIETHAPVKDAWRILHPDSAIGAARDDVEKARGRPVPTADECLYEHGATCDSTYNTWRWTKSEQKRLDKGEQLHVDGSKPDPKAKRLDYIFFGGDPDGQARFWELDTITVGMRKRHPKLLCSLSDHFSVEATLQRIPSDSTGNTHERDADPVNALKKGPYTIGPSFLPVPVYDKILAMIHKYTLRERRQRRLRVSHFGCQVIIAIACLIAIWWSPRNYVSFLLMLLSTLGLSYGVIDGLMGGLFVGSEIRALKEFEWEIINAKNMSAAQQVQS